MVTFKDSMCLMRSAVNEADSIAVTEKDVQLALHRAWQCMAAPFPTSNLSRGGLVIEVLSSQCEPSAVYAFLNRHDCSQKTKLLVTIDPIDLDSWDSDVADFESSVILYNFAIAHSCQRLVCGRDLVNPQLLRSSYAILQLTHSLAFDLFEKSVHMSHLCNPIMLINTLLTRSLVQMSFSVDAAASEGYCRSLRELVFLIDAYQRIMSEADNKFAAAA